MASIVDSKFYPAFGALVYSYATVEVGIKFCVAGMMKTELESGLIAFAPYTATSLANVAKVLADEKLQPDLANQFKSLVGRWQKHNDLRTYIAHFRWRTGQRPESIKPTTWDIRGGTLKVLGFATDERDYTTEEIFKAATDLADLNEEMKSFLKKSGLDKIIDPNTETTSDRKE